MTLLLLTLACTNPKPDSSADSSEETTDTGTSTVDSTDSGKDTGKDTDSGGDTNQDSDSGQDTGTANPWAFSDERSLVSAIEPAAAPGYIAGLLDNWLKYGADGPHCPDVVDEGGGTVLLDGRQCTSGQIEGMVRLSGLDGGQLPTGTPVNLSWDNFGSTYGLYLVHGMTGSQVMTRQADGSVKLVTTDLTVHFDPSTPRMVPSQVQWSGDYHFVELTSDEGPYHSYGTMTGTFSSAEYGEVVLSWNFKFSAGSCEESFYYPAAGLWTGAQKLNVSWDGDKNCDGCVPYTLDSASGGFCK